jgi:hypothetical protein
MPELNQFCGRTRRELMWEMGAGFFGVALTAMLDGDGFFRPRASAAAALPTGAAAAPPPSSAVSYLNPLAVRPPHFAPKA